MSVVFIFFYNYVKLSPMNSLSTFIDSFKNNEIISAKIFGIIQFVFILSVISLFFKILNSIVKKITVKKCSLQIQHIIDKGIRYAGFAVMVLTVFHRLGIDIRAILGAAGIAGAAIGFAAQTSISNIISGLFVITERAFRINDVIEVEGTIGTVQSINLLSVILKTFDSQYVRIPNETIIKANLINYSQFPYRRVKTELGVAYGTDLRKLEQILLSVAKNNAFIIDDPAPSILWTSFSTSSIDLTLMAWTKIEDFVNLRNSLFVEIDERLKQENIEIPFQQLDIHIKGNQTITVPECEQSNSQRQSIEVVNASCE
ncbi:mechanosensitive ion channel family protein [Treponema vincentii]|uniref:mechanosensitive ion channel family protein n=1 Tax=Treponema vincentii TaxID=69710 RepID=UPI0020A3268F|nr:mechanosensitive ion channel family protein [Treponema vincentii]